MASFDFLNGVQENPDDTIDILKCVQLNPNGTLTRLIEVPNTPPTGLDDSKSVQSIDVPLNATNNTWARIFRPTNVPSNSKLPIVLYFHGGGFILLSAASSHIHDFCVRLVNELNIVIVSVEYRLAPENRLPAAYEDAFESILWVKNQALRGEENLFIKDIADFSQCFLMGTSSGGNIVYHAGLSALNSNLGPMKIIGLILDQPFFGGVERNSSEMRLFNNELLPLRTTDLMWELALPIGADRDHEFSNPMIERSDGVEIKGLPKCLVRGYGGDPLIDRMKELVKMLEGKGVKVVAKFVDGGYHGVEIMEPMKSQPMLNDLKDFIYSNNIKDGSHGTEVLEMNNKAIYV